MPGVPGHTQFLDEIKGKDLCGHTQFFITKCAQEHWGTPTFKNVTHSLFLLLHKEKNPKVSLKLMNVETCVRFDKFGTIFSKFSAKTFSVMNKNA